LIPQKVRVIADEKTNENEDGEEDCGKQIFVKKNADGQRRQQGGYEENKGDVISFETGEAHH
jgi:hypothetical protein